MTEYTETYECIDCGYQFQLDEIVIEAEIDCPNCEGTTTAKSV
jgi:DNA-directed RNA polymerase subunit RPC12/RpoP